MWRKPIRLVEQFLDNITMYRLLLYYLICLLLAAMGLSFARDLHYSALDIAGSAILLVAGCWVVNKAFATVFKVPINPESSILTGLILALLITPTFHNFNIWFMAAAAGLAMSSKYILAINGKHIFNPAAIALVLTAFGPHQVASWWVGSVTLLPFVLIGGILLIRKMRRELMAAVFLFVTLLSTFLWAWINKTNLAMDLRSLVVGSPIFFLASVMLVEPYSSPTTKYRQLWYAALVGFLVVPGAHIKAIYTTPELALVIGNIYAFIVSPKTKLLPVLRQKNQLTPNIVEFVFTTAGKEFVFQPGQYMEFTLPHSHPDSRGSRRWFTLASSPTESDLRIAVKFYKNGSTYKKAMRTMTGATIFGATQLAGDFVLPAKTTQKLVFIAGGIGVTPFRSMTKYLIDTNQQRAIQMLYAAHSERDLVYRDVFEQARHVMGMQTTYVLSNAPQESGRDMVQGTINHALIEQYVPDYQDCIFYLSGTHTMVKSVQYTLQGLGVRHSHIKVDFFPGYV